MLPLVVPEPGMAIEIHYIAVSNGGDNEGALLLREGELIALLVRLGADHEADAGQWFVEWFTAGAASLPQFESVSAACTALDERWLVHQRALAREKED